MGFIWSLWRPCLFIFLHLGRKTHQISRSKYSEFWLTRLRTQLVHLFVRNLIRIPGALSPAAAALLQCLPLSGCSISIFFIKKPQRESPDAPHDYSKPQWSCSDAAGPGRPHTPRTDQPARVLLFLHGWTDGWRSAWDSVQREQAGAFRRREFSWNIITERGNGLCSDELSSFHLPFGFHRRAASQRSIIDTITPPIRRDTLLLFSWE